MSENVKDRNQVGEEKCQEVYVLMIGYPGAFKDPYGSELVFPYVYGATIGVFYSLDEVRKFISTMKAVAADFLVGVPLEQSAKRHGISEELVKRIVTISGFFRLADPEHEFSVFRFCRGEYSVMDSSEILSPAKHFPLGLANA